MVVTEARQRKTVADAEYDYTINGIEHPVSDDLTAQTVAHKVGRAGGRITAAIVRQAGTGRTVVAAGRLRRADGVQLVEVQLVEVQCTDCPWGLKVYGWDTAADRLAQRHADARQHVVMQTVVR